MKIFAVVVTYNRLELLKKAIDGLMNQNITIDCILIINNGSTDGTDIWLNEQDGIKVVNQDNLGGSGGFWRGIKEAYTDGADYIWCMDDDVHPEPDCLGHLIKAMPREGGIVAPLRFYRGQEVVFGETKHFNLDKPFKPLKDDLSIADISNNEIGTIPVEAISFEGPMISRSVVDKIGWPEKDLFIFWDDTSYSYKAYKNGFKILSVPSAHLYKEDLRTLIHNSNKRSWKYPYMIRNLVFFVQENGKGICKSIILTKIFFKFFGGLVAHLFKRDGKYSFYDIKLMFQAFNDGLHKRLGKY